jgi:hypothetical protein
MRHLIHGGGGKLKKKKSEFTNSNSSDAHTLIQNLTCYLKEPPYGYCYVRKLMKGVNYEEMVCDSKTFRVRDVISVLGNPNKTSKKNQKQE